MEFLEKNIRVIAVVFVLLIVVGLGITFSSTYKKHKEEKAQDKFAQIEFDYSKYKEELAKSKMPTPPETDAKEKSKVDTAAEAATKAAHLRTQLMAQLNQFIASGEKTIATRIAALYLSELYLDEGKSPEALTALKTVDSNAKDLTSILVQKKIGSLLADSGQCNEALKVWEGLLNMNTAKFAHAEVKIMQSLCYQKMNDLKKAEEILLSVKNDKSEGSAEFVQHADRILRLIQFKKASGT